MLTLMGLFSHSPQINALLSKKKLSVILCCCHDIDFLFFSISNKSLLMEASRDFVPVTIRS